MRHFDRLGVADDRNAEGETREHAEALLGRFHDLLTKEQAAKPALEVGKLALFSGVREYPVRVKCATLAWHTLKAAEGGAGRGNRAGVDGRMNEINRSGLRAKRIAALRAVYDPEMPVNIYALGVIRSCRRFVRATHASA
jgi:hypothetical protein